MGSVNPVTGIKGMDVVMANLNREIMKIKIGSYAGMLEAAILIRRDMEKTSPLIPIDTGNLRASWFTVAGLSFGTGSRGGTTSPKFKGDDAGELAMDHTKAVAEYKAQATALTNKGLLTVFMGFSANYAVFVHEMVDAQFSGRGGKKPGRPGSGAKFLEASLNRNAPAILKLIQKNAYIK